MASSSPYPPIAAADPPVLLTPERYELADQVRELHASGTPWLPAGLGTRLHWGPPVRSRTVLSVRRLAGVLEHNPGDFTISVEAGAPLQEVQATLERHRQWLALDPPWGSRGGPDGAETGAGSLGGLVARGLAGGYRQRHLGVRDQLIGIGLLRADGVAARAGGRVVKNVAGYDLMRLLCGSWGSLALITELTLRTLPLPPRRRALRVQGSVEELSELSRWVLGSSLSPERLDWWSRALAASAGLEARPLLLVALASVNAETLEEQIRCIRERTPLECTALSREDTEHLLATARAGGSGAGGGAGGQGGAGGDGWLLRLGVEPERVGELLALPEVEGLPLELEAGSGLGVGWTLGTAAPGTLTSARVDALRRHCRALGGYLTVLVQPPGSLLPAWENAPSRPLIEAVKRQFDPQGLLAPGRLPGAA